jgi:hypothetical protein
MKRFIALLILVTSLGASTAEPGPRALVASYLSGPGSPGDAFHQAQQFDHFDYRTPLRLAAAKDRAGLLELLEYNSRTSLMGEGAEDHASILIARLGIWGDRAFAEVLQACSEKAVSRALGFLEYGGVTREQFPRTFSVQGTGGGS